MPLRDLSFSDYLDVMWAHQFAGVGAFTSPHDYRELMKAIYGYSDKTIEEVQAEIEARKDDKPGGAKRDPIAAGATAPKPEQLDALAQIMAQAQAAKPPPRPKRKPKAPPPAV